MKIKANIKQLSRAINKLRSVAGGATTLPMLSSVLVDCRESKDAISISATNLDQYATITIPASVTSQGAMAVSAALLSVIIHQLDGEEVTIEKDAKHKAKVQGVDRKATLYGLDPSEFPQTPTGKFSPGLKVDCAELSKRLRSLSPLMSKGEHRYVLEGVTIREVKGMIWMISTNGRALGIWKSGIEYAGQDAIIPEAAVSMLSSLLDGGEGEIALSESMIKVSAEGLTLVSRLVEGNAPNFMQVIPEKERRTKAIPVDRKSISDAMKFVSQAASKPDKIGGVTLDVSPAEISLSYSEADRGEVTARIDTSGKADEIKFAVNPKLALAALGLFADDVVTLECSEPANPFVIEDDNTLAVIMPIRIG